MTPTTPTGQMMFDRLKMKVHPNWLRDAIFAIETEAAAAERERLRGRVIQNDDAGIFIETPEWPLGLWVSPEDFLADPEPKP